MEEKGRKASTNLINLLRKHFSGAKKLRQTPLESLNFLRGNTFPSLGKDLLPDYHSSDILSNVPFLHALMLPLLAENLRLLVFWG